LRNSTWFPLSASIYMDQRDKAKQWLRSSAIHTRRWPSTPIGRTAIDWGVYGAPETFLVDGQGRVIYKFISPMTPKSGRANFCRVSPRRAGAAHEAAPPRWRGIALALLVGANAVYIGAVLGAALAGGADARARRWMPTDSSWIAALQTRFEHITAQLRCLVCQNESIADSNVELAGDLRRQVREMLLAGKSDDAIFDFMTDRYGEFVRFSPPLEPKTLLIWGAPFLMLLLGGVIIFRIVRAALAHAAGR
jgi:cytochrome c-type biogenesis protein CcmH/NrfF